MQDRCKVYTVSYMASNGSCFMVTWIICKNTLLEGGVIQTGDHGTRNAHNRCFSLFHDMWAPTWIEIHWNSMWLRARSHMTSHYTWGSMTTRRDFLGRPLDTFFRALTMSWSQLLARVWSGPYPSYNGALAWYVDANGIKTKQINILKDHPHPLPITSKCESSS
jgi:hypothetical protein